MTTDIGNCSVAALVVRRCYNHLAALFQLARVINSRFCRWNFDDFYLTFGDILSVSDLRSHISIFGYRLSSKSLGDSNTVFGFIMIDSSRFDVGIRKKIVV